MIKKEELKLTQEWDKTFPKSDKVEHSKVTFVNRYGITLAADMYVPKKAEGRLPAIVLSLKLPSSDHLFRSFVKKQTGGCCFKNHRSHFFILSYQAILHPG